MSRLLAVLAPLVILGAVAAAMVSLTDEKTAKNIANAGLVLNGEVSDQSVVAVMEASLDEVRPELLILGNSYANTNLDIDAIEAATGLPTLKLTVPNTTATHWYAMLDNRVFQRGLRPSIVVVFSDIQSGLLVQPMSEASALNLEAQLDGDDPVIARNVAVRNPWWARVTANRVMARDWLLAEVRDAGAGAASRVLGMEVGPTAILAALDRVLGDGATDPRLRDVAPLAGTVRAVDLVDPALVPDPMGSMLPEIAELCREHGSTLVVVRSPMSPEIKSANEVPAGTVPALHEALSERGALLVDLTPLPMREGHYELNAHMTVEGAARTTRTFVRVLDALGLVDDGVRPGAEVLGGVQLRDGVLELPAAELVFASEPRSLEADPLVAQDGVTARIAAGELEGVTDDKTLGHTPLGARCSPVRVWEDGAPLPLPNTRCDEVRRFRGGRSCHVAQGVVFTTVDGTLPRNNGRKYQLALDPDRRCDNGAWLYPGDRLTTTVPADQLARLTGPSEDLVLAFRTTQAGVEIRVRVTADGVTAVDRMVAAEEGFLRIPFDVPIAPTATDVAIRLGHPSARGLVLVTRLALEGPADPVGPP